MKVELKPVLSRNRQSRLLYYAIFVAAVIILTTCYIVPAYMARLTIARLEKIGCKPEWEFISKPQDMHVVSVVVSQDTLAETLKIIERSRLPFNFVAKGDYVLPHKIHLPKNVPFCSFYDVHIPDGSKVVADGLVAFRAFECTIGKDVIFDFTGSRNLRGVEIDGNKGEQRFVLHCRCPLIYLIMENYHELALTGIPTSKDLVQLVLKGYRGNPAELNRLLLGGKNGIAQSVICLDNCNANAQTIEIISSTRIPSRYVSFINLDLPRSAYESLRNSQGIDVLDLENVQVSEELIAALRNQGINVTVRNLRE